MCLISSVLSLRGWCDIECCGPIFLGVLVANDGDSEHVYRGAVGFGTPASIR
jgi:hypothetical protein